MGFAPKRGFTIGQPETIKANMKDGFFQLLCGTNVGKQMKVAVIKIGYYKGVCLFPHNEDDKKKNDWAHILYQDIETGDVCSTLVKTYSEGELKKYLLGLKKFAATSGEDIDYTDVVTTMTIVEHDEKNSDYKVEFTFGNVGDNPSAYMSKKGAVIDGFEIDRLDEETFSRSKELFEGGGVYDIRIGKELAISNLADEQVAKYNAAPAMEQGKFALAMIATMGEGILTVQEAKALAAKAGEQVAFLEA